MSADPHSSDIISDGERTFPFRELLNSDYFLKYRVGYYAARAQGLLNPNRNYVTLLTCLSEISEYNEQHGRSYAKRLRESGSDWRNAEAVFAEIIVYRHYLRPVYEELIKGVRLDAAESDLILERLDGTEAYLEIFCVMPNLGASQNGKVVARSLKTHTQHGMASVRQKLLRKITKQKQFSKARQNYAVIELNDAVIAGDFSVLSSLSSGYTVTVNKQTMDIESCEYNWENSIFDDESTSNLKAIIYFNLGDYSGRRFLFNPKFQDASQTDV